MINDLKRMIPIVLLFSCGIPSSKYIGGATVLSSTDSEFSFKIDLDSWGDTNSFTLYSRYFTNDENKKASFPDDLSLSDTHGDSVKYIEDLGFTLVSLILSTDETEETIDEFLTSVTETFSVIYDQFSEQIVYMSRTNGDIYYLQSNHENSSNKSFAHNIGTYSDDNGRAFLSSFESELDSEDDDVTLDKISIEFVLITTGISSDSGTIDTVESLPEYITKALEIQTN